MLIHTDVSSSNPGPLDAPSHLPSSNLSLQ